MKKKLSLQDFSDYIVQHEGIDRKTADAFVRSFFDVIEQGLNEDKFVKIKGFGTFKLVAVSERESVNINTGERFQISGHTKVSFTPDTSMKELINRPFAHFEAVDLNDDTDTKEFEVIDEEMETEEEEYDNEEEIAEEDNAEKVSTDGGNTDNNTLSNNDEITTDANAPIIEIATEQVTNHDEANKELQTTPPTPVTTDTNEANNTQNEETANADNGQQLQQQPQSVNNVTPVTTIDADNDVATEASETAEPNTTPTNNSVNNSIPEQHNEEVAPHNVNEEEIVVTDPTPVSTHPSAKLDSTNNTLDYTYNEVPSPRKRNWWKDISLALLLLLLMMASYFIGYYRMLCPTCGNEIFTEQEPRKGAVKDSLTVQPTPPAANATYPANDSLAATRNNELPHAAAQQTQDAVSSQPTPTAPTTKSAEASKPATTIKDENGAKDTDAKKTSTPQRPTTHRVTKGDNIYRIARKYYGSDNYAEKIIKANNLKNADNIVIGMELKLP